MSTATLDLKARHAEVINAADAIVNMAERQKRNLTTTEHEKVNGHLAEAGRLKNQMDAAGGGDRIAQFKAYRAQFPASPVYATPFADGEPIVPKRFLREYRDAFYTYLESRRISASLTESVDAAGGFAAPITVANEIVPLAPADLAVRRLATVIATKSDRLIPQKSSFGSAALTTEASAFGGTAPTLSQISLTAYMVGTLAACSLEVLQDVPEFEQFVLGDISEDIQQLEEGWFVNGSGSGQPQGLIGNVGAGVTEEPDTNGNLVSISGILDLIGSLSATYLLNASFLMSRATSIVIRKAQVQSNLFFPAFTTVNGQDYLFGHPVYYSASMPTAARGACPVLFGDVRKAYVIGDRGGSAVRMKVVDQMWATAGTVGLIGYRRTDGRVRRSEAIQSYNVSAS
jgi:HK97 family phage major capsid protein